MIDYDLLQDIINYSHRHLESSKDYYISINQNPDKLFHSIFNGKMAEWSNYHSLLDAGYIVDKPPCMRIFSQADKCHDADLIILGKQGELFEHPKHVHIKAVLKANYEQYGYASFLVSKTDPIVENPPPHHFYSVMLQESLTSYRFYKWLDVSTVEYAAPKQANLHTKLAVYL